MQALDHGRLGLLQVDLTVGLAASALLRLWARWLPQFAQASVPYLLSEFIHRPGWMSRRPDGLLIEVESRPLDIVLEMSGYLAELERVPWLGNQNIRFQRRE